MDKRKFTSIDAYIKSFPVDIQEILQKIRQTIHLAAPDAAEAISYGMPAFKLNGNLVFFAAFTGHIGLYPFPSAAAAFKKELSVYKTGKGSIQFPLDQPVPYDLITRIVQFRVAENLADKGKKVYKKTI